VRVARPAHFSTFGAMPFVRGESKLPMSDEIPTQSRLFPILGEPAGHGIAWHVVERHERRIFSNHNQTLERLAERGGLSWIELWIAFNDYRLFQAPKIAAIDARNAVMDVVRIG
jgi:hypothetical protein